MAKKGLSEAVTVNVTSRSSCEILDEEWARQAGIVREELQFWVPLEIAKVIVLKNFFVKQNLTR